MEPVGRLRLQEQPVLPDHRGVHSADHPRERSSGVVRVAQRRDLLGRRGPRHGRRSSEGGHEARGRRGDAGGYPSPGLLPQARHAAGVGERVSRAPRAHRVGEGADDPGGFLTAQGVMAGEGERRIPRFSSPAEIKQRLAAVSYLADEAVAMTVYLADRLEKPILCEGPAGVGKTALGKGIAAITGHRLTRLQCYEGLDEAKALYEWNYKKQLLRIQADSDQRDWHKVEQDIFTEDFLLARPLLAAIRSPDPVVLLIDEVDRVEVETEALLLEVLSDWQGAIPELGTITATRPPLVVLTSNNTRELSEALKRRCLFLHMEYPTIERETAILRARIPDIDAHFAEQIARVVHSIRGIELKKAPSVSETLDWARTLRLLGITRANSAVVRETLPLLLKYQQDIERVSTENLAGA